MKTKSISIYVIIIFICFVVNEASAGDAWQIVGYTTLSFKWDSDDPIDVNRDCQRTFKLNLARWCTTYDYKYGGVHKFADLSEGQAWIQPSFVTAYQLDHDESDETVHVDEWAGVTEDDRSNLSCHHWSTAKSARLGLVFLPTGRISTATCDSRLKAACCVKIGEPVKLRRKLTRQPDIGPL